VDRYPEVRRAKGIGFMQGRLAQRAVRGDDKQVLHAGSVPVPRRGGPLAEGSGGRANEDRHTARCARRTRILRCPTLPHAWRLDMIFW